MIRGLLRRCLLRATRLSNRAWFGLRRIDRSLAPLGRSARATSRRRSGGRWWGEIRSRSGVGTSVTGKKPKCGDGEPRIPSAPLGRPELQLKWAIQRQWDMDEQISGPSRSKKISNPFPAQKTDALGLGTSPSSFKVTASSKRHMVEDTDDHGSEPKGGESWGSGGPPETKRTPTEGGSRLPQAITNRLYRRWVRNQGGVRR